jgi:hypothetical protein
MFHRMIRFTVPLLVLSLAYLAGCGSKSGSDAKDPSAKNTSGPQHANGEGGHADGHSKGHEEHGDAAGGDHEHKPGAHGGTIVSIGDSYHAEAVFEKGGSLRIHTLGKDEGKIQEVELQTLTAYARPAEGGEAVSFQLEPEPQPDDAEGKTSAFVGMLPEELRGKSVDVTIPSIRINGERFRFSVKMTVEHHDEDMPAKVNDAEEEALYLTPGGIYTAADITANGNTTASRKFKGIMSSHNMKPKPGEKICPVTMTVANPKFTWVVGGKAYEFCCPPCVDEFVKTAKEHPDDILSPEEYVKK